jgi:hypothetical protein
MDLPPKKFGLHIFADFAEPLQVGGVEKSERRGQGYAPVDGSDFVVGDTDGIDHVAATELDCQVFASGVWLESLNVTPLIASPPRPVVFHLRFLSTLRSAPKRNG